MIELSPRSRGSALLAHEAAPACIAWLVCTVVVVGAVAAFPAASGMGVLLAACALVALAWVWVSPLAAVVLLLLATLLRLAIPVPELPIDLMTIAFFGALASVAIGLLRGSVPPLQIGALEIVMALYVVWNITSALTPHALRAVEAGTGLEFGVWRFILTGTVIPLAAFVIGRRVLGTERAVRVLLWIVVGITGYSAVTAVLQFYGPPALVWPQYILASRSWPGRAVGIFDQPVMNGMVMVIGFVVCLHVGRHHDGRRWRQVLAYAVALLAVAGIYLTYTRAVWLAFGLVLVLGAVLARRARFPYAALTTAAVVAIVVSWSTFTSSDREAGGVGSEGEVEDRLNTMETSFWAISEEPLVGWGIGRFMQVNSHHHKQWAPDVGWDRGYGAASHHNELGIAVELGLVGLALWLMILVLVARLVVRAMRTLSEGGMQGRGLGLIGFLVFVVLIIIGATVDLRFLGFAELLAMLLLGLVVGTAENRGAEVA
jgi:O-antigen ligase